MNEDVFIREVLDTDKGRNYSKIYHVLGSLENFTDELFISGPNINSLTGLWYVTRWTHDVSLSLNNMGVWRKEEEFLLNPQFVVELVPYKVVTTTIEEIRAIIKENVG